MANTADRTALLDLISWYKNTKDIAYKMQVVHAIKTLIIIIRQIYFETRNDT